MKKVNGYTKDQVLRMVKENGLEAVKMTRGAIKGKDGEEVPTTRVKIELIIDMAKEDDDDLFGNV